MKSALSRIGLPLQLITAATLLALFVSFGSAQQASGLKKYLTCGASARTFPVPGGFGSSKTAVGKDNSTVAGARSKALNNLKDKIAGNILNVQCKLCKDSNKLCQRLVTPPNGTITYTTLTCTTHRYCQRATFSGSTVKVQCQQCPDLG